MKKMNILWLFLSSALVSCSHLPVKAQVKEHHFRLENFSAEQGTKSELVYLMCFHKRPTEWSAPKQYLAGEHQLWVKASVEDRGLGQDVKEAFVQFKVKLEAGKSYMLNRAIEDNQISLWIQETETGAKASDVIVTKLKQPLLVEENLRKTQCREGTV